MIVRCVFCTKEIDTDRPLTYQKVTGWEHPRMAGGTNALALREPHGVYACSECIGKQRRGIPVGQGSLL